MKNEPIPVTIDGKTYHGYKKLPKWLREVYLRTVNYKCEQCPSKEKLQVHRPKMGISGGLYMVAKKGTIACNWEVLCEDCHQIRNYSRRNNYQNSVKVEVIYK